MKTPRIGRRPAKAATQKALTPAQAARDIIAQLRRMGDPAKAQGVQKYFKHEISALGIATPELLLVMRGWADRLREAWSLSQAIKLCDRLLREPEIEIRGSCALVLDGFKNDLTLELLPHVESWLEERLDNWALVDGFCSLVLSPLLRGYPEVESALVRWSGAKSLWKRRAALVTLVPFARKGDRLDLAYQLAQEHFPDPEDLMHKATGWLLREAGKTDAARLRRFLIEHGPTIPRTALRYAIERFPAADRAELLRATRSSARCGATASPDSLAC